MAQPWYGHTTQVWAPVEWGSDSQPALSGAPLHRHSNTQEHVSSAMAPYAIYQSGSTLRGR
jgi:hypothetical protein